MCVCVCEMERDEEGEGEIGQRGLRECERQRAKRELRKGLKGRCKKQMQNGGVVCSVAQYSLSAHLRHQLFLQALMCSILAGCMQCSWHWCPPIEYSACGTPTLCTG